MRQVNRVPCHSTRVTCSCRFSLIVTWTTSCLRTVTWSTVFSTIGVHAAISASASSMVATKSTMVFLWVFVPSSLPSMSHLRFVKRTVANEMGSRVLLSLEQETARDGVKLTLPDPQEHLIENLAQRLNIRRIGWIFTDLVPDESKSGSGPVLHHRGNVVCSVSEERIHSSVSPSLSLEFLFLKCSRMYHRCLVPKQSSQRMQVFSRWILRFEICHCGGHRSVMH